MAQQAVYRLARSLGPLPKIPFMILEVLIPYRSRSSPRTSPRIFDLFIIKSFSKIGRDRRTATFNNTRKSRTAKEVDLLGLIAAK